jgi:predicted hydrocarbon binding protein
MANYEPFEAGVEVNGQTILSVVKGAGVVSPVFERKAQEFLSNHGIDDPQPGEWYPQADYLAAFEQIERDGGAQLLTNIGREIPKMADWPEGVASVAGGLESINRAYQMNHRGGEIGSYRFEATGSRSGVVYCENPYPCLFDQGIVEGVVSEFGGTDASLSLDETGSHCRSDGADECQYTIEW